MIKAQDLRIGNWVFELEYVKVATIGKTGINVDSEGADIPFDCLGGIPLSPVILEAAGFENLVKDYEWSLPDNSFYLVRKRDTNSFRWHHTELFYLHELQNLYHALTGEELTIDISLLLFSLCCVTHLYYIKSIRQFANFPYFTPVSKHSK